MVAVLLVAPVPPFDDVIAPLVLFLTPALVPVTVTATVQVPLAAIVPPLNDRVVSPGLGANVPPQDVEAAGVLATANPDGRLSVNATPFSAVVVFGFVIVKVSTLVPPSGIVAASNDFAIVGGPTTVIVAVLLVAPAPLSFELTGPVVLLSTPAAVPVTVTLIVQLPAAAIDPPASAIVLPPLVVSVPPLQVDELPLATDNPAGRTSVNDTPVNPSDAFGFVIVKDSDVVPPTRMLAAPNDFDIVGAFATVRVAVLLVAPVPPLAELTAPVVLFLTPPVVPVTVTLNVQLPLAAIVAPVSVIRLLPVTVSVPPH